MDRWFHHYDLNLIFDFLMCVTIFDYSCWNFVSFNDLFTLSFKWSLSGCATDWHFYLQCYRVYLSLNSWWMFCASILPLCGSKVSYSIVSPTACNQSSADTKLTTLPNCNCCQFSQNNVPRPLEGLYFMGWDELDTHVPHACPLDSDCSYDL